MKTGYMPNELLLKLDEMSFNWGGDFKLVGNDTICLRNIRGVTYPSDDFYVFSIEEAAGGEILYKSQPSERGITLKEARLSCLEKMISILSKQ